MQIKYCKTGDKTHGWKLHIDSYETSLSRRPNEPRRRRRRGAISKIATHAELICIHVYGAAGNAINGEFHLPERTAAAAAEGNVRDARRFLNDDRFVSEGHYHRSAFAGFCSANVIYIRIVRT